MSCLKIHDTIRYDKNGLKSLIIATKKKKIFEKKNERTESTSKCIFFPLFIAFEQLQSVSELNFMCVAVHFFFSFYFYTFCVGVCLCGSLHKIKNDEKFLNMFRVYFVKIGFELQKERKKMREKKNHIDPWMRVCVLNSSVPKSRELKIERESGIEREKKKKCVNWNFAMFLCISNEASRRKKKYNSN